MAGLRVNFDVTQAKRDPRFKRLKLESGLSTPHTFGACLMVWSACYENKSTVLSRKQVDAEAEIRGFADHMISCELAIDMGDNNVHVCGVEERIKYLKGQKARSDRGVAARREKAQSVHHTVDPLVNQAVNPTIDQTVQNEPMGQSNGQPNGQPLAEPSDLSDSLLRETNKHAREVSTQALEQATAAATSLTERRRVLGDRLWQEHIDRHEAVRVELRSDALPLRLLGEGRRLLAQLLIEQYPTLENAEDDLRAYLNKREYQARVVARHVGYFGDSMWSKAEYAARGRLDARPSNSSRPAAPPSVPQRKSKRL